MTPLFFFLRSNGYCVERGSGEPPHLAPKGSRCNFRFDAYPQAVTEAFRKLAGPLPLPIDTARQLRQSVRRQAKNLTYGNSWGRISNLNSRRGNIMREFDPAHTILIRSTGEVVATNDKAATFLSSTFPAASTGSPAATNIATISSPGTAGPRRSQSGRILSENYRWRGYEDMMMEEDNYRFREDSDDEDFELPERNTRRSARLTDSESDSEDEELQEALLESLSPERRSLRSGTTRRPPAQRRRQRRSPPSPAVAAAPQPTRASSRRRTTSRYEVDESDEDEQDDQILSTNNDETTGPHKEDYDIHFFKLPGGPDSSHNISRQWLRRLESETSYEGRRFYAPQVGEDVVYIPRVHSELIQMIPSLKAPWQSWPDGSAWPVVSCVIRDIRYRFPFKDCYRSRG